MDKVIVLSIGHTPMRQGAVCGELKEHRLNSLAALALEEALVAKGFTVVSVDPMLSLAERVRWVNEKYPRCIALEFHHNVFNTKAKGSEMFYKAGDKVAFDFGSKVLRESSKELGLVNRGMRLASQSARGSLAWLKCNHGLLWEICFMDNPEEITKVLKDNYRTWAETVANQTAICWP